MEMPTRWIQIYEYFNTKHSKPSIVEKDNSDLTVNYCLDVLEAGWKGEVGQQLLEKNV